MKKMIFIVALFFMGSAFANVLNAENQLATVFYFKADSWKKVKNQTWPGIKDGTTYWYKIDKMAKLWWSTDGKKWAPVDDGAWMDKDGKWLKINDGKLVWSSDGKDWAEVPEWKWQASDGKWYKFDQKWELWVNE